MKRMTMMNNQSVILATMKPALVIFGLGNPGKQYENTRHNAGFMALDVLSGRFGEGEWCDKRRFDAFVQEARVGVAPVYLVKPKTYMNLSGDSVRKAVEFFGLDPSSQIIVLSDDIDLPAGELRLRMKGGPGTHNGLKSIVNAYGENFPRLRIGIGSQPPGADLSNWVLSAPTAQEREALDQSLALLPHMIEEFVLGKVA